jgi:hypothetical protein
MKQRVPTKSEKRDRGPRLAKRTSAKAKRVEEGKSKRSESAKEPKAGVRVPVKSKKVGPAPRPAKRLSAEAKHVEERESKSFEPAAGQPLESGELSVLSARTRVVLLPVNPYLVHVYWEVAPDNLKKIKKSLGRPGRRARPVLRFYDVTNIAFDGTNAQSWFDVEIDLQAVNWYVHLWSPDKTYCVDLGLRPKGGQFYRLARSNVGEAPRAGPSAKVEERYLLVRGDYRRVEAVPPPVELSAEPPKAPARSRGAAKPQITDKEPAPAERRMPWPADPSETAQVLAELEDLPEGGGTASLPDAWLVGGPPRPTDITEMNEESFRFGISSGRPASTRENTAVREHQS